MPFNTPCSQYQCYICSLLPSIIGVLCTHNSVSCALYPQNLVLLQGMRDVYGLGPDSTSGSDLSQVKIEPNGGDEVQMIAIIKDRQKKDNHNMSEPCSLPFRNNAILTSNQRTRCVL